MPDDRSDKPMWEAALVRIDADGTACVSAPDDPAGEVCLARCDGDGCSACSDGACGPGVACDASTCVRDVPPCAADSDCAAGLVCIPATDACGRDLCVDGCVDARATCDENVRQCVLGPPVCTDDGQEPDDALDEATAVPIGATYQAVLCRSDVDVLVFPVQPNKRYRATVTFVDFNAQAGVSVSALDGDGVVQDAVVMSTELAATVTVDTPQDSTAAFFVRIAGDGTLVDEWRYTVRIEESAGPGVVDCTGEVTSGTEPNGTVADAFVLDGTIEDFSRCGLGDVDYYKIDVPPLVGIDIAIEFDDEDGDIDVRLIDAANPGVAIDTSTSAGDVETVSSAEGPAALILEVKLRQGATGSSTNQSYQVRVTSVPRPAACSADMGEPDGSVASAQTVALGSVGTTTNVAAIRCNAMDDDVFRVTIPAGLGGTVGLRFDHAAGDLRLDVLDDAGDVLAGYSSNRSNSTNGDESVDLPQDATSARDYWVRVALNAGTGTPAQAYTLSASTYDAAACLRSEPTTDDDFAAGRCVGTFTSTVPCNGAALPEPLVAPPLATCAASTTYVEGCGTACGATDQDTHRVGTINNGQVVQATLTFDPTLGDLGLGILRRNAQGVAGEVKSASDTNADGVVTISIIAPTVDPLFAREHAVMVKPIGIIGFAAQPYALSIDVGPECLADDLEPNESPADATLLRPVASDPYSANLHATLCGGDVDVYELVAQAGEVVTANLSGPTGLVVEIGARPADLTQSPDPLASAASGAGDAVVENVASRQLFVSVKQTDTAASGAYDLVIEAN